MKDDEKIVKDDEKKGDGLAERDKAYVETFRRTKDPKAATRAYCAGNQWLTENAKAVGNWK